MKVLPYESWTINSPLDAHTIALGMTSRIEPKKIFRGFSGEHTLFQGSVSEDGFTASRIIHYRNSFLPILYGRFIPSQSGTTIQVRMMLHPIVLAFLCVWFGMLGLFSLAGIASAIQDHSWGLLGGIGVMGAFALLLTYGAFFAEAGKAKQLISEVIQDIWKDSEQGAPPNGP